MNPYQFRVGCGVCGGVGMGTIQTSAAEWYDGGFIYHTNPRVCAENLARARRIEALKNKPNKIEAAAP